MTSVVPPIPLVAGDVGAALLEVSRSSAAEVIELAAELTAIPAPTNEESLRSKKVRQIMPSLGFEGVVSDDLGDVVGILPGTLSIRAPRFPGPALPRRREARQGDRCWETRR